MQRNLMQYIDDTLAKIRILSTGDAGFSGSNIAHYFQKYHVDA